MTQSHFDSVSIRSLVKTYSSFKALDDVSLEISAGEFLSILGPSGSGKTTLLQLIGGFARPSSGRIFFGDNDITLTPPQKREIGVVFQNYALFPHLNVANNVAFPLKARKVGRAECDERVAQALQMVELSGFAERPISKLSGGQRQRVALARAIVFEPRLILMDEPLSALDKNLRESMQLELRKLHEKLGATIVYVTHDQREALTMSDRIAVMNRGRIVQVDAPQTIYRAPVDRFVASFVGEATLVPVDQVGLREVRIGKSHLRTIRELPEGRLFVALQADAIVPCLTGEREPDSNYLEGRISELVFQGESFKTEVELADGTVIGCRIASHHFNMQTMRKVGDPITLKLHVQDTIVVSD